MKRNISLPHWIDVGLRTLKYFLLGFFLYAVGTMSAAGIKAFMQSPYGLIADVKMLNFFRFLGGVGLVVIGGLLVLSVLIQNFWCRYLCPYGAMMGLASLLSPLKIRRNPETCIDCAKCAKACPSSLPVDRLVTIRSVECTACLECVAACPAEKALVLSGPTRKSVPAWTLAVGLATLFVGTVEYAKISHHWDTAISPTVYQYLVRHAEAAAHPVPNDSRDSEVSGRMVGYLLTL